MARKPRQVTVEDIIVDFHAKAEALARGVTPGDGLTQGDIAAAARATIFDEDVAPLAARAAKARAGRAKAAPKARAAKAAKRTREAPARAKRRAEILDWQKARPGRTLAETAEHFGVSPRQLRRILRGR